MQVQPSAAIKAHKSLRSFANMLIFFELVILILFAVFVRILPISPNIYDRLYAIRYGAFQDVNVMMLIGFGFLMTFMRSYSLASLAYTFLVNVITMQTYLFFSRIWFQIFEGPSPDRNIYLYQGLITQSSYCVASILIALGGVIGRIGPKQIFYMTIIQGFAYSFNEAVNVYKIVTYDAGGSMAIHAFGAYFGLGVSYVLSKKLKPIKKPEVSYNSNVIAMIGTLFLWIYWPSFNFAVQAKSPYEQNIIISNTLLSLTGSCISTLIVSGLIGKKLSMEDVINATLAGGVAVGATSGVTYYPSIGLAIGFFAGVISTLGFRFLTPFLERKIGLYDSCGIHNLHGIPGVMGGICSAIVIASYNNGFDTAAVLPFDSPANTYPPSIFLLVTNFLKQGGLQLAGTFTSMFFGLIFGTITGYILKQTYDEDPTNFFNGSLYIQIETEIEQAKQSKQNSGYKAPVDIIEDNQKRAQKNQQS